MPKHFLMLSVNAYFAISVEWVEWSVVSRINKDYGLSWMKTGTMIFYLGKHIQRCSHVGWVDGLMRRTGFFCARWNCWKFSYISLLMWLKGTLLTAYVRSEAFWRWKYRRYPVRSPHKYRRFTSFELDLSEIYFAHIPREPLFEMVKNRRWSTNSTNQQKTNNWMLGFRLITFGISRYTISTFRNITL